MKRGKISQILSILDKIHYLCSENANYSKTQIYEKYFETHTRRTFGTQADCCSGTWNCITALGLQREEKSDGHVY